MTRSVVTAFTFAVLATPLATRAQDEPPAATLDVELAALDFLVGRWRIPDGDPILVQSPAAGGLAIIQAEPVVGGKALRWRQHVSLERPGDAEAEGLIYWDPAEERIEYVAVGGPGEGQGRLFVGRVTPLEGGRVELTYDVHYRTLTDTPGEELGGSRRRFREVYERDGPDGLTHTLEWWHEGRWQPWGRGRYSLVRAADQPPSSAAATSRWSGPTSG